MNAAAHNIIRLDHVTARHGATVALDDVTTQIPCGSLTAILGPNGAGKSTLLRAILGWHALAAGEIRIGDAHPNHARPRLAYLPQRPEVDWDFPITLRAVVKQGRYAKLGLLRRFSTADEAAVDRALSELELTPLAARQIRQLSGGQQQRMFLARALAQGADIFLLDEPFAGLDLRASAELAAMLRAWRAQGRTVLAVVHDLALARACFDQAVLLNTTLVAAGPLAAVLSPENIAAAYGPMALLSGDAPSLVKP